LRFFLSSAVVVFTVTIFTSATLLFQVQPMIAKMILPKFGGTPAVWNTCMVFFQAALLLGYAYAHAVTTWLSYRAQIILHMVILALPLVTLVLPIRVSEDWSPGEEQQVFWLLWLLVITVGLPFLIISTSAPLLQKWFSATGDPSAKDPYFLYAASNIGSMVSLFGYPVVIEPFLALNAQGWAWAVGYVILLGFVAYCATFVWRATEIAPARVRVAAGAETVIEREEDEEEEEGKAQGVAVKGKKKARKASKGTNGFKEAIKRDLPPVPPPPPVPEPVAAGGLASEEMSVAPSFWRYMYWITLAFVPSSLMLAVTTYLTTDIASIPLLWLPPLTLYLLTFIIVFSKFDWILDPLMQKLNMQDFKETNPLRPGYFSTLAWKVRRFGLHQTMVLAMPVLVLLLVFLMVSDIKVGWIGWAFLLHLVALFVVAMVCHGELARTRPSTQHLTAFYLAMSFGGMLGGIFNAMVAPEAFIGVAEYPLVLMVACLLLPAFEPTADTPMNFWIDVGLAVALGAGAAYALVKFFYMDFTNARPWEGVVGSEINWVNGIITAIIVAVMIGYGLTAKRKERMARWLDVGLPVALCILSAQLIFRSPFRTWDLKWLANPFDVDESRMVTVLTYGLPVALCYGFAERPIRFGLGVGAIFLAAAFNAGLHNEEDLALHKEYVMHGYLQGDKAFIRSVDLPVHQERSFFGVLKVEHRAPGNYMRLLHGTTLHGEQRRLSTSAEVGAIMLPLGGYGPLDLVAPFGYQSYLHNQERGEALTYYHKTGPVGQIYQAVCGKEECSVAFIGLGTGTMASYVEPGQKATFYEIDPAVIRIAKDEKYFTYLRDCELRCGKDGYKFSIGDARLKLRDAPDHSYRLIVVDAFSSDAIPIHLITEQAIKLYFQKLTKDGVVAIHISNRHLDLGPVLGTIGAHLDKVVINQWDNYGSGPPAYGPSGKNTSDWVAMANNEEAFRDLKKINAKDNEGRQEQYKALWKPLKAGPPATHWTDDYSNLLSVMRWR